MTVLRMTSVYTLVTDYAPGLLDRLKGDCPLTVTESLISGNSVKLRFRAGDDTEALAVIAKLVPDRLHQVFTGAGVNQREVLAQPSRGRVQSASHRPEVPGTGRKEATMPSKTTNTKGTSVKHNLVSDGAPFDEYGNRIGETGTSGDGSAKCACGWLSDVVDSRAARKAAHTAHKADPGDNPEGVTAVPYTKALCFFNTLGVDGAAALAGTYDSVSDVAGNRAENTIAITAKLDARQALEAALPIMWDAAYVAFAEWKRENRASRKGGRDTAEGRKAMFDAESEFLVAFCEKYAAEESVL